jgi:hypothetical protein
MGGVQAARVVVQQQADPVLDDVVFPVARVEQAAQAPTLAGRIQTVLYWYEGLSGWVALDPKAPPSVPQGTAFYLAIGWVNGSNVNMTGHVDLIITGPDGAQVTPAATGQQDQAAAPGNGFIVNFEPVTLDQAGAYQGRAILSGVQA